MFLHTHPYKPFLFPGATKLIVGTLPPPRFTTRELREGDVDFCYGSRDGQLWPILDGLFNIGLTYENTGEAIDQRIRFLRERQIGICDIVESAERDKVDASDLGMREIVLRDLIEHLGTYPGIRMLLFTGGNSKNGPEYLFRRLLKSYGLTLQVQSSEIPRIHSFVHPRTGITIKTVSLIAPSGAANRAVGSLEAYKRIKVLDSTFTTLDFRKLQYAAFF